MDFIDAADGSRLEIQYASDDREDDLYQKAIALQHWSAETPNAPRELLREIALEYSPGITAVRDLTDPDDPQEMLYVFDMLGQLTTVWDQDMVAQYTQYNYMGSSDEADNEEAGDEETFTADKPHLVSRISAAQPMIGNLARNHSFEDNTNDWTLESSGTNPGTAEIFGESAYAGGSMLAVNNPSQQISTAATQTYSSTDLGLKAGESYTLSAYIALPEELNTKAGGARLTLSAKGGLFQNLKASSEYVTYADDWVRYDVTVAIPANWSNFRSWGHMDYSLIQTN